VQIFKKLLFVLTSAERKHSDLLIIIISDMVSLDFITFFMAIITNPNPFEVSTIFNSAYVKTQVV
jgi:hypothetical protein